MSLIGDIARSYLGPKREIKRQLDQGVTEEQTLFFAMLCGFLNLIAQTPALYRRSLTTDDPFAGLFASQFVSSVFLLPLALFAFAALAHLFLKLFKGKASWKEARRAFIWPALVASPLVLISGVLNVLSTSVLINFLIGLATAMVFIWQLCSSLAQAEFGEENAKSE